MLENHLSRRTLAHFAGVVLAVLVAVPSTSAPKEPGDDALALRDVAKPSPADEEVLVTAEPTEDTSRAVAMRMLDTHLSNSRGRHLYKQHRYSEAAPHLLAAAKRGFKMSQARLGEILVLGLGDVDQDVAAGMGWMGVAASGTTLPSIRNRFNELRSHVPPELHARLSSVVAAYTAEFGSEATGVNCLRGKSDGYFTIIYCRFEDEWMYADYFGVDANKAMAELFDHPTQWPHGR